MKRLEIRREDELERRTREGKKRPPLLSSSTDLNVEKEVEYAREDYYSAWRIYTHEWG